LRPDGFHVFPGENIQDAIEAAAKVKTNKVVKVHEGEYRPKAKRPAMIWLNQSHDGVVVEAVGKVVLTAANPDLSRKSSPSYPAVVNHVVYFGHGISSNTVLRGFRITGANAYVTDKFVEQIEPDQSVPRNSFFITDGGAIKIFGKSAPTLENLEIVNNYASPCGGGVSVQQQGLRSEPVIFRNCIFEQNRAQVTGAALDLLEGSSAIIQNCLFVENVANTGSDIVAKRSGEKPFTNSGALTIFQNSSALVDHCTFAFNRNGVDDLGGESTYLNCLFYNNTRDGSPFAGERYDLDLRKGGVVRDCWFSGKVLDPAGALGSANHLNAPDPKFDSNWNPTAAVLENAGFRR
jgi:hypothetical protein